MENVAFCEFAARANRSPPGVRLISREISTAVLPAFSISRSCSSST